MKFGPWNVPVDHSSIHVDLRMRVEETNHLVQHRPSGMTDVEAQLWMLHQHIFEQQWIAESHSVVWSADVRLSGGPGADVNANDNVQFFSGSIAY